jgi:hypothetical protein
MPASGASERDNKWPDGTRVMVRNKPKSWSEATIYTRLDVEYWRVKYPSGGTGMFKGGDIRVYDAERDAKRARQPRLVQHGESRLLAVLGISESEYVTRFTSPTQTDWVMRCTARKVLRAAEQEPVVLPPRRISLARCDNRNIA